MARIMFNKRLEAAETEPAEGGAKAKRCQKANPPAVRHIKERLGRYT